LIGLSKLGPDHFLSDLSNALSIPPLDSAISDTDTEGVIKKPKVNK
jgi:hypothetical protein